MGADFCKGKNYTAVIRWQSELCKKEENLRVDEKLKCVLEKNRVDPWLIGGLSKVGWSLGALLKFEVKNVDYFTHSKLTTVNIWF